MPAKVRTVRHTGAGDNVIENHQKADAISVDANGTLILRTNSRPPHDSPVLAVYAAGQWRNASVEVS
jgi:hypothetical protein